MAAVGLIAWGGWNNLEEQYLEEEFPPGTRYMDTWGLANRRVGTSEVVVKGYLLKRFIGKNKLIAVCLHANGLQDPLDIESSLSKSEPFDINDGLIHILIKWNEQFGAEAAVGRNTGYVLLLTPANLTPKDFRTIHEAQKKGAHLLDTESGPP